MFRTRVCELYRYVAGNLLHCCRLSSVFLVIRSFLWNESLQGDTVVPVRMSQCIHRNRVSIAVEAATCALGGQCVYRYIDGNS